MIAVRHRPRRSHEAVLVLPPPTDDFDVWLHAQQKRVLRHVAHVVATAKYRWRREHVDLARVPLDRTEAAVTITRRS